MYMIAEMEAMAEKIKKEHDITNKENKNEVEYKMSLKMLKIFLRRGIIDDVEYAQIDALNRESFSPYLKEVYV
ncbi:SHOCT domain-containing protein [Chakrabartyella piscis]|uniref:SHOCT domain-containing protein n=1 Tax=Chakrabartyella piscis TaxID=2918914 RepID=UPI0029584806|nr:SHOCT domain-containing protein [Chakrabartyella piscis]